MPRLTTASFSTLPSLPPDKITELDIYINTMEKEAYSCIFQRTSPWLTFWFHIDSGASLPPAMLPLTFGVYYDGFDLYPLQEVVRRYLLCLVHRKVSIAMTQSGAIVQKLEGGGAGLVYYSEHFMAIKMAEKWTQWLIENKIIEVDSCEELCMLPKLV